MPLFHRGKASIRRGGVVKGRRSRAFPKRLPLACCIAGLFCPTQLALVGLDSLTQPLTLLGFIAGICYILLNAKDVMLDAPVVLTMAFVAISLTTTAIQGQFTTLFLQNLFAEAILCLIIQIALRRDGNVFIKISFSIIGFYVIINLLFILANISTHPNGYYRSSDSEMMAGVWLLGHKNQLRNWIIPLVASSYLWDISSGKTTTTRTLITTVAGILSAYYSDSATTFAVLLVIGILLYAITALKRYETFVLNPINGALFVGVLFFICVFMRRIPVLGSLIEDLLGRDASFTGRIGIWDSALLGIAENPFGSGYFTTTKSILATDGGYIVNHAHNAYLDTLLKYGVFGFAAYMGLVVCAVQSLLKHDNARVRTVLSSFLVAFLACGVFGELFNCGFAFVLYLCCYSALIGDTDAKSAQ